MEVFKRMIFRMIALVIVTAAVLGILVAGGHISFETVDAVTKATGEVISPDSVTGTFTVYLNQNADYYEEWKRFFESGEYDFIPKDITCYVASSDAAGLDMAESLQSNLPTNLMKVKIVPAPMIVEKVRHGVFEVMVISDTVSDMLSADVLNDCEDITVIPLS